MEIRIKSYLAASFLLECEPNQWNVLVILDSGWTLTNFLSSHSRSFLALRFDDIDLPRSDKLLPSKTEIQQGLDFSMGKEKLIVCCRAGQSRSAALAYLIACRERGASNALHLLDATRHSPNRLVVTLGESLSNTNDALDKFHDWKTQNSQVRLSDYSTELESAIDQLESQGAINKICKATDSWRFA